ncbi:MAG: hypothetical protein ACO1SX_11750 [Actinomycetota bacterium]
MNMTNSVDEELQAAGVAALVKELGPLNALRFLQLMNARSGDYTAERDAIIGDPTFEELMQKAESVVSRNEAKQNP